MVLGTFNFAIPKVKAVDYIPLTFTPAMASVKIAAWQFQKGPGILGISQHTTGTGTITIGTTTITLDTTYKVAIGIGGATGEQCAIISKVSGNMPIFAAGTYPININITGQNNSGIPVWFSYIWSAFITLNSIGDMVSTSNLLSASISGPSSVDLVSGGTWTANVTGGVAPYTYAWTYGRTPPHWDGSQIGGTTLTKILNAGNNTISLTVKDSLLNSITTSFAVNASTVAGAYSIHLIRSGAVGEFVDVFVKDVNGADMTISGTIATKDGIYDTTNDDLYNWYSNNSEAVQLTGGSYTWRYNLRYNAADSTPLCPPSNFWFQSSIHLAVPNIDILIMHHFVAYSDGSIITYGPDGSPIAPEVEVPPEVLAPKPAWWNSVWDFLVTGFNYLFKPTADQMAQLIPSASNTIIDQNGNTQDLNGFASTLNVFQDFQWGAVASGTYAMTVHFPKAHPNENQNWTITILTIDFDALNSQAFITVIRTGIQALIGLTLFFILITSFLA